MSILFAVFAFHFSLAVLCSIVGFWLVWSFLHLFGASDPLPVYLVNRKHDKEEREFRKRFSDQAIREKMGLLREEH